MGTPEPREQARPADVGAGPAATPPSASGSAESRGRGGWLNERLGLRALAYPVPAHANGILYTLGGISLVGFIVLVVTGIYLAQFYNPEPSTAHDSVLYIMTAPAFGQLVCSIHYWAAYVVAITVSLHLLRVFLSGSHKAPRDPNCLVGLGLLAVTIGFFYTRTVIKWDEEGLEALAHTEAAGQLLGGAGARFSPAFSLAVPLLVRVYFAHVAILPALFTVFVAGHILLIKALGMAPLGRADGRGPVAAANDQFELVAAYDEPVRPFTSHITTLFLDIGGVLLTNGWDRYARERAATNFKLDLAEMDDLHQLNFATYEEGKLTLEVYLDRVVFHQKRPFTRGAELCPSCSRNRNLTPR